MFGARPCISIQGGDLITGVLGCKHTILLFYFSLSCLCFAPCPLFLAASDQSCCFMILFPLLHRVSAARFCLCVQLLRSLQVAGR